jgi:hypothetical protein
MSESVSPFGAGRGVHCARIDGMDCPEGAVLDPPPVLGPFIGVTGAVLCSLVGAFLLLAPFAFDYRQGASAMPHSSVVDLATGGGVLALGLLTAIAFGAALVRRLRVPEYVAGNAGQVGGFETEPETYATSGVTLVPEQGRPEAEPSAQPSPPSQQETQPAAPAAATPLADPGGALRDLLTPLVAALAADLRARETGETEGKNQ